MLESLKCALKSVNSSMRLYFVSIPESMVPENLVTTILAKGSEKAGTDNSGKPCRQCALQINVGITSYPAALSSSLRKRKGSYFPLLLLVEQDYGRKLQNRGRLVGNTYGL